jgi:hypothetical protein
MTLQPIPFITYEENFIFIFILIFIFSVPYYQETVIIKILNCKDNIANIVN